jgi:hypothetical protein
MKSLRFVAPIALALSAQAQLLFTADIRTVQTDSSSSAIATRLYLDSGFTQAASATAGYNIWFVADTARNGVPTLGVNPANLLGSDDRILFRDRVDGDQPGSTAGRFRRNGAQISSVDVLTGGVTESAVRASNIYVYLWNDTTAVSFTPEAGDQFGIYNLGTFTVPEIGNAFWGIDGNVNATQFTVAAVPEPQEYAAMAGGALIAFAVWRRRQQQQRA